VAPLSFTTSLRFGKPGEELHLLLHSLTLS
jgi:hypothetical protein